MCRYIFPTLRAVFLISIAAFVCSCTLLVDEHAGAGDGPRVGVIEITGMISDSREVLRHISDFSEDKSIKAIVLRIDSGGGAVGAVQEMYREVMKLRGKKKVAASFGNTAASGGYYVASAADRIFTNPGTVTGSIGAIMQVVDIGDLMDLLKIKVTSVKSGNFKESGTIFRAMTPEEQQTLQDVVTEVHRQFISDIAKGRGRPQAEIEPWANGMIMTGAKAIEAGLVDEIGDINDAVEWAAKAAGAQGKPVMVTGKKKGGAFFRELIRGVFEDMDEAKSSIGTSYKLRYQ